MDERASGVQPRRAVERREKHDGLRVRLSGLREKGTQGRSAQFCGVEEYELGLSDDMMTSLRT